MCKSVKESKQNGKEQSSDVLYSPTCPSLSPSRYLSNLQCKSIVRDDDPSYDQPKKQSSL